MSNFTFTSNMKLKAILEKETSWYQEMLYNFTRLDTHTHADSLGVQIPTAGIANDAVTAAKIDDDADFTMASLAFATANSSYLKMIERATDPTNVANYGFIYTKDTGGVTELYYEDSAAGITQLTSAGSGGAILPDTDASDILILTWNEDDTSDRVLNFKVNSANRTIDLSGDVTTAADLITAGAFSLTLTTTASTDVTLPTTGTLSTLAGAETFTNKTITAPDINGGTADSLTGFSIRSSGAAYDLEQDTAEVLTGNKKITWTVNDTNRTIDLAGNLTLSADLITVGADSLTFTTSAATDVTLPTTGTLTTLAGSETLTNKVLTAPDINGGTADSLTGFSIRSSGAAFDLEQDTAEVLTGNKKVTWTVNDTNRTIDLAGNLTLSADLITVGADSLTFTTSAATDVTLPTTGTLTTLSGSETLTNKTITTPDINGGTVDNITSFGIRSSGAAFDMLQAITEVLTADKTLTWTVNDTNRAIDLGGDLAFVGDFSVTSNGGTIDFAAASKTLTVELDSIIDQDLSADANVGFAQVTVGNTGLVVGTSTPFSDAAGTLTLQNIDTLDATTEATIEAAIDTLANLTSIQSQTVTLAGTLGVEANSLINQDLTSDSTTAAFAELGATTKLTTPAVTNDSADVTVSTTTSGDVNLDSVDETVRISSASDTSATTNQLLFGDDTGGVTGLRNINGVMQYNDGGAGWNPFSAAVGANAGLSNLAGVAINTDLISDTDNTDDLGSSAKTWKDLYLKGQIKNGDTNLGLTGVPVGVINAWVGGYFGDGSNGSYTRVLGTDNTVAAVNTLLNSYGWYVCDGSALNDADSPIFNGASRYLPNLTDDRFIMGDTVVGGIGGSSTMTISSANLPTHTHAYGTLAGTFAKSGLNHAHTDTFTTANDSHSHTVIVNNVWSSGQVAGSRYTVAGYPETFDGAYALNGTTNTDTHNHVINGSVSTSTMSGNQAVTMSGSTSDGGFANTATENRPKYLSCFYIMKVK